LYRVEINPDLIKSENFELSLINNIEETAIKTGAKVLIIDNLTYLCIASEKGESASILMMSLMTLKRRYNLSILVLAHTPKRALSNPITQNDLAGSKKLFNFFDSCFAIGRSAKDSNLRYIKQIKVRYGNYTHDTDNVIVCSIEKVNSFLQFVPIGFAEEREHLKEHDENERDNLKEQVKRLQLDGKSQRQIAKELGLSLAKVNRLLK
jgi:KaiC/GvpD/RAD55 family RecA-like ATPase